MPSKACRQSSAAKCQSHVYVARWHDACNSDKGNNATEAVYAQRSPLQGLLRMSRVRSGAVAVFVMTLRTGSCVNQAVVNRRERCGKGLRFTARTVPLSSQSPRHAHDGEGVSASVEDPFLDMDNLRCRHQGKGHGRFACRLVL
jgi:hypothetical protein